MKCRIAQQGLIEYAEDSLPPGERADVEAHLIVCAACRAEVAALQRAENALRKLSVIEPAPESADVLRRHPAPRCARRLGWAGAGAGLAVALVVLTLLVWPHATTQPAPSRSPSTNVAMKAEPAEPPAPDEAAAAAPAKSPASPPAVVEQLPAKSSHRPPAPRRIVQRQKPALSAIPEPPTSEPVPAGPPLPEPVAAHRRDEAPAGIILLIGESRKSAPSSSYYAEISFPDGAKSVVEQTVERDADNQARVIRVAYERTGPEAPRPDQGG